MYESPIRIIEDLSKAFNVQIENDIVTVTRNYDINIDKEELLKALRYDRDQYEKGYADGMRAAREQLTTPIAVSRYAAGLFGYCPNCNRRPTSCDTKSCGECGQALDWSEDINVY